MPNSTLLEQAIILTIIYYDVLNKPLTAFEIWKYILIPNALRNEELKIKNEKFWSFSLYQVIETLNTSDYLNDKIGQKNGLYFLKYRGEKFFDYGIKTQKICAQKIKLTLRYIKLIKYIPFVRAIFLSGSVAMGYASQKSDLDLLIVSERDKIWLVRAMVVFITFLFGIKRSVNNYSDKICLNHFITTHSLEIPFQSIYTAQLYARLLPLYEEDAYLNKFYLQNKWLENYLANYSLFFKKNNGAENIKDKKPPIIKKIIEIVFEIVDLILGAIIKKIQVWLIRRNPLTNKSGGRITYNDKMLEFHPNSREREIIKNYNDKILKLGYDQSFSEHDSGLNK